jgi:hypothetical protein
MASGHIPMIPVSRELSKVRDANVSSFREPIIRPAVSLILSRRDIAIGFSVPPNGNPAVLQACHALVQAIAR